MKIIHGKEIPNIKMIRDISSSTIRTRNDLYTLMYTENKRKLLFTNDNYTIHHR